MTLDNPKETAATVTTQSIPIALVHKKLRLAMSGESIQFAGKIPPTPEQVVILQKLNIALDEAVQLAVDAACFRIQAAIGVECGGFAAMHFASGGPQELSVRSSFATYLIDEVEQASSEAQSDEDGSED